jgi:signal transduction histidine kinase
VEVADPRTTRPVRLSRAQLVILDAGAAVALTAVLLSFALAGRHPAAAVPGWAVWLLEAGVGLPLGLRRLWPVPAFLVALAASLVSAFLGLEYGYFASVAATLYLVALAPPWPVRLPATRVGLIAAAAVLAAALAGSRSRTGTALVIGVAAMAGAWTVGRAVQERRAYAQAEAEHLVGRAVSEERLRIARELHDVVAHSMSLIAVKAGVANHVARIRPEETADALRVIEDTSKGALTEMRRLLGVLRTDETPGDELAPAPGLGDLPELVRRAVSAGIDVDFSLQAGPDVPVGVGLSAYRIVQEALTNVVRHAAAAHCRVTVTAEAGEIRIEVLDDGAGRRLPPAGRRPGHGLAGMRERALVCGGELTAGPLAGSGFQVKARLPYTAGSL